MTTEPSPAVSLDAVALLVVHGIGSQKRGETLNGVIGGMRLAYGDPLNVQRVAEDHAILGGIGRPIHVFEVFWADLLQGEAVKGTFDFDRVFETVWFPLLNSRSGRLSTKLYPRWQVLRWTLILAPLSPLLWAGFLGTRLLATFPTAIQRARRRSKATRRDPVSAGGFWERIRERRKDPGRTILDDVMDQVAADVLNYVYAVPRYWT